MHAYAWMDPAVIVSVAATEEHSSNPPLSPTELPVSTPSPSAWTHTFRIGPSVFAAAGPAGSCGACWFPAGAFTAMGARFDYVLQKGTSRVRWHNIASVDLGWGTHTQPSRDRYCGPIDTPVCTCHGVNCTTEVKYGGLFPALFLGTGFRVDSSPASAGAFVMEVDGTIGASTAPHLGLLGLHLATGARVERRWEFLASVEGDIFAYAHASAALVVGWSP